MNERKKLDYRHYICSVITIGFVALAIFYFKFACARIVESLIDVKNSALYYVSELFELGIKANPTINNFTKTPFEMPFNLPNTWEEFVYWWERYWQLFVSKENIIAYLYAIFDLLYYLSKFLIIVLPIVLIVILLLKNSDNYNNDYNEDSKGLIRFKRVEKVVYLPIKKWVLDFIAFLKEHTFYCKLWAWIWAYNFNVIAMIIEFIAFYLYFVVSFDLVNIYVQVLKLLMDLSIAIDFIPTFGWLIIFYCIIDIIRRKIGYDRLNHMENMNRGFINERPIVIMACGSMGKKKTTIITDIALSEEIILRDKAFEKLLECDLRFPFFPWINLENYIKMAMERHLIYNLATCRKVIKHLQYCVEYQSNSKAINKSIKRHLKKDLNYAFNGVFDYDEERYGNEYYDELAVRTLWETIETYSQLYFIYVIESSLLLSNYSIRVDNILEDLGNFPLWNSDFFKRDKRLVEAYSRHAHILDFDSLRLGKQIIQDNLKGNSFEFGVINITEIGKERGNNLELQQVKKNDDSTNQKNDLFNAWLKMVRHSATVDNYPFVKVITDEQRPESWGADARDLCEIVNIDECSEMLLSMPLFNIGDIICSWLIRKFSSAYYNYRFERGDNTLLMYLYHGIASIVWKYQKRIYNTFGYFNLTLQVESGRQNGEIKSSKYFLMCKKIYSKRFSTDCFSGFFHEKALRSELGLNDLEEFASEKASFEEMMMENSYFFNDLIKIKEKYKEQTNGKETKETRL